MSGTGIFGKISGAIRRWFALGLEEEEFAQYSVAGEYDAELAMDNLEALQGYCKISYPLLILFALLRWIGGAVWIDLFPFLAAGLCILWIQIFLGKNVGRRPTVRMSYCFTGLFNLIWCAAAIWYDIVLQPGVPAVMICLTVLFLMSLYNAYPRDNIIAGLLIYIIIMVCDFQLSSARTCYTDAVNILLALILGVCIGQRNTRTNISRKLYTDMYKTVVRTSILVVQVDLVRDTFEVLQAPDYMLPVLSQDVTASQGLLMVEKQFVAAEFQQEFLRTFNFAALPKRLESGDAVNFYFLDFRQRWCQLEIVEQERRGRQISAVVAVVRDVDNERRREFEYQRQLRDAVEEAHLASASKTNFLRRMSHDIRTPINGIRGMLEIAEHYPEDVEKQKECREKMWKASGYLLSLVNDVLDMNKLESGTITLEHRSFGLREMLSEANTVTEMQAIEHGIRFEIDWENVAITHNQLLGSPVHLKQILQNLASNAVKYNRRNGSVTVSCRELKADENRALFQFVCTDTGIGMSREFQEKAFEPFSQEGRVANTTYAGTGLGLSIVKELVERMGGRIELRSTPDVGSTFTVIIPFEIDHTLSDEKEETVQRVDTRGKKVLLVEDNELNTEIAKFLLEKEGFTVATAVNGQDAVEQFLQSAPYEYAMIFMDIMMPVMNGLEATRRIRKMKREDAVQIPIIAMSANAFQDDIENSLAVGMNVHLMKPLEPDKVDAAIQKVLHEALHSGTLHGKTEEDEKEGWKQGEETERR